MNMRKLLLAASQKSGPITLKALEGYVDVTVCTSMEEAQLALSKGVDLVMCGLHFDEGRMLDFLRFAKANPDTRSIPFICVKSTEDMLSPVMLQSVEIASKALGAARFVDLYEWRTALGDEQAFQKLRDCVAHAIQDDSATAV